MRELPKLLFVVAVESDAFGLIRDLINPRKYNQNVGFVHGGIWRETSCRVLVTGVHPDAAEAALREALGLDRPLAVVSLGMTSALGSDLQVGDLLIGTEFHNAIGAGSRYPQMELSGPVRDLMRLVVRMIPGACGRLGSIVTVADRVQEPMEKLALAQSSRCDVADTTALPVAVVAEEANLPWVVVRSVLDISNERAPDLQQIIRAGGKISTTRILGKLAVNPARVFSMRELVRRAKLCRERLEGFANAFLDVVRKGRDAQELRVEPPRKN